MTPVSPWADLGSDCVGTPGITGDPAPFQEARALRRIYLNEVAEGKRRDPPKFSPWAWEDAFRRVLKAKPSKDRDQKLWNLCVFVFCEHYGELPRHRRPLFLYGMTHSSPTPAPTWSAEEARLGYARKRRNEAGHAKMKDADMLRVAGKLVVDECNTVCVFNTANYNHPKGGVWTGKAAQEEYFLSPGEHAVAHHRMAE